MISPAAAELELIRVRNGSGLIYSGDHKPTCYMLTLNHYTLNKVRRMPDAGFPYIKIVSSGAFYIYARMARALRLTPGDHILFSEDKKTGTWYISKDDQGLPTYTGGSQTLVFHSQVLREEIMKSCLIPGMLDAEVFYLGIDTIPILSDKKIYYRLKLLS